MFRPTGGHKPTSRHWPHHQKKTNHHQTYFPANICSWQNLTFFPHLSLICLVKNPPFSPPHPRPSVAAARRVRGPQRRHATAPQQRTVQTLGARGEGEILQHALQLGLKPGSAGGPISSFLFGSVNYFLGF